MPEYTPRDPFDLQRYLFAQKTTYEQAFAELKSGRKTSHWMWFIFPQLKGLGRSSTSQFYGINGKDETIAYLAHPVLGRRLIEISQLLVESDVTSATIILGRSDDRKLHSCATLFHCVAPEEPVFLTLIEKFFLGRLDRRTVTLLDQEIVGD